MFAEVTFGGELCSYQSEEPKTTQDKPPIAERFRDEHFSSLCCDGRQDSG